MMIDCAILGGGPAGLNAALVLGRARRTVLVFDDQQPRNAVTQESHGFLTRDGIKPDEFRKIAYQEVSQYPSVQVHHSRIMQVRNQQGSFELVASNQDVFHARSIIIATGLKERLPAIEGIHEFYGKSLFSCPYCDGWERRDQPLVVISEGEHTLHLAKITWNWSRDVLVCTNGHHILSHDQQEMLRKKGIEVVEDRIAALMGKHGHLERIVFATQGERQRNGGFVATQLLQASPFGAQLECAMNAHGGIVTDQYGRTSTPGVYAAGEASLGTPSQLVIAAASGSSAAIGVNTDLTEKAFL